MGFKKQTTKLHTILLSYCHTYTTIHHLELAKSNCDTTVLIESSYFVLACTCLDS